MTTRKTSGEVSSGSGGTLTSDVYSGGGRALTSGTRSGGIGTLKTAILWLLFTAAFLVLWALFETHDGISYDSAYQYFLNRHSWSGLMQLLRSDYSPPLYTYLLKAVSVITGGSLFSLRAVTVVIYSFLFAVILFPGRRLLGPRASVLAAVFVLCSRYTIYFGHTVRPAVLAFALSTAFLIHASLFYDHGEKRDLILMTVYGLLSMYTHNTSLIIAFCSYGALAVAALIKRDFPRLRALLVSGVIVSVLYLPWLFVLLGQLGAVKDGYWVSEGNVASSVYYAFIGCFENGSGTAMSVAAVMTVVLSALLAPLLLISPSKLRDAKRIKDAVDPGRKERAVESYRGARTLAVLFAVSLAGFIAATYVADLYAGRYFFIYSGAAALLWAAAITSCDRKNMISLLCTSVCAVNIITGFTGVDRKSPAGELDRFRKDFDASYHVLPSYSDIYDPGTSLPPLFVHVNEWDLGITSYLIPEADHLVTDRTYTVLNDLSVFEADGNTVIRGNDIFEGGRINVYVFINEDLYEDGWMSELIPADPSSYEAELIGRYNLPYNCNENHSLTASLYRLSKKQSRPVLDPQAEVSLRQLPCR